MTSVAIADMALTLCSQRLLFAGQPVLFKTNDPMIARHAGDFFPENDDADSGLMDDSAKITVHVRASNEGCDSTPWFRARGHFAFAQFTHADVFWFNLRTREVYGVCTPELAKDRWRWQVHIFPTLLGILSPVIDVVPVHAACLVCDGHGVLLTGQSGVGKSTLTIALAQRGYALLSDEWTYLSAAGRRVAAWGVPVPVKLLPDARRFFPELLGYAPARSLNGEMAYEVWPDECFGVSQRVRCSVNVIALLERSAKPGCDIARISPSEAIDHLKQELEPLLGPLARHYEQQLELIQGLAGTQCLRVSFNDRPNKVAESLDTALDLLR